VGDHIKHVPFISYLVEHSGGIFAPRGGTPEARDATVELLVNYQKDIETQV